MLEKSEKCFEGLIKLYISQSNIAFIRRKTRSPCINKNPFLTEFYKYRTSF